jgi:hypothetical protein
MIGRVVKEVSVANVSDFDQRSKISAETSRDGLGELFLSVWSQEYEVLFEQKSHKSKQIEQKI